MKYIGKFYDLNENQYTLNIITGGVSSNSKEITLGDSPFTTEMDSTGDTLYKSAKYQSATIQIVSDEYYFDMYASGAQDNKVILYNASGGIEWTGYLTPNVYNNSWVGGNQLMEVEAIDALSTLQYYKYEPVGGSKAIVSFTDIISSILTRCNAYSKFYFSTNTNLSSAYTDSFIDHLVISEENFFDEKNDGEEDSDVSWTMQEVLEEICQYMGVTAIAFRDCVYFLDYDAIKAGINTYYEYSVGGKTGKLVTLTSNYAISSDTYAASGQTINLDDVYNKVTVTDKLYDYDSVIPDFYGNAENITKGSDPTLASSTNVNNGRYGEVVSSEIGNGSAGNNNNMVVLLDRVFDPQHNKYTSYNVIFVKYFKNPYYKFYQYNGSTRSEINSLNYTDTKSMHGAVIAKFGVRQLDKTYSQMQQQIGQITGRSITLDQWLARNEISSVSFSDYIMLLNPESGHISNSSITSYPYFETSVTDTTALFGGKNAYLVISGSYSFHYFWDDPYPIPDTNDVDIAEGRYSMDAGDTYLLCRLQWGSQYWNGTTWTASASTFKLPYMKDDSEDKERRADNTIFRNLSFVNTVSWRIGTDEKGYLITLPKTDVISGLPKLTVYKPFDPNYHSTKSGSNEGQHYKHSCVFLKDFNIKAVIGDPTYSGVNKTDTEYSNIINSGYVNELKKIEFKICTWDNKAPNYSAVAYNNNGNLTYLDKTYCKACYDGERSGWTGYDNTTGLMRQEEHLIYRLCNQYSQPAVTLKADLNLDGFTPYTLVGDKYLSGKKFIVDEINVDYALGAVNTKLIEKR